MAAGILTTVGCAFLIWLLIRAIKINPQQFSRENLSSSFTTMGILALILIAVIGLAVVLLRKGS